MKAWQGRRFSVLVEDGYEIADTQDAVAIVAVDAEERVVLVRQARPAVGGVELLELPAGIVDEGEEPLATARRELREETGLHGGSWRELAAFWTSPGFTNERVTVFAARGLEEGEPEPDDGEDIEIVRLGLRELDARLAELEDVTTLVGVLLYLRATGSAVERPTEME